MDWEAIKAELVAIGQQQRAELVGDGVALDSVAHPVGPAVALDADADESALELISEVEVPDAEDAPVSEPNP